MTYNDQSYAGWSQVIVVLLLAAGAIWIQLPIEPDRPAPSGQGVSTQGIQDVDARLWQDPFEAVNKAHQKNAASQACVAKIAPSMEIRVKSGACATDQSHSLEWLKQLIQAHQKESQKAGKPPIKVMLAMVPGGTWVGADEARRRTRYAVLAGLNAEGYIPKDPEHIGYAEGKIGNPPDVMPFEWMRGGKKLGALLLIWLDDEALSRDAWEFGCAKQTGCKVEDRHIAPKPLGRLTNLLKKLGALDKPGKAEKATEKPEWLLIGPSSSTFLFLAARETDIKESAKLLHDHGLRWYSPFATRPHNKPQVGKQPLGALLPDLVRVTADDDTLTTALVDELRLRRFGSGDAVALVGQWDTPYSQTLRRLLKDKIGDEPIPGESGKQMQVLEENYLRGLDGKLPEGKDADKKTDGKDKEKTAIEPSAGDGQIDYLRRLAWKLKKQERDGGEVHRIGAIGVLGNDYYDKLLVLKALRPMFPDALFFTTEVDAAMLNKEDNKFTRNLIVASGYGLNLATAWQKDMPPFRDNDQTAAYIATRQALNPESLDPLVHEARDKALLFEIGRSELVPLSCVRERCELQADQRPTPTVLTSVAFPVALVAVTWFISVTAGFTQRRDRCTWGTILLGTGIVAAALFALAKECEPMLWLEGVSIWPSEVLRLIALALALALFWKGIKEIRRTRAAINHEFFGEKDCGAEGIASLCSCFYAIFVPPNRLRRLGNWLLGQVRFTRDRLLECHSGNGHSLPSMRIQSTRDIWAIYNGDAQGTDAPHSLRMPLWVTALTFVAAFYCMAAILAHGVPMPQVPARGDTAFVIDGMVLGVTLIGHLSLLFLAMFEGFRAVWLARTLQGPTRWPEKMMERFWPVSVEEIPGQCVIDPWLDVRFIAHATEPAQRIIFYPFVVLSLLMLSRSDLFDRWVTPVFLVVIYAVSIALVVIAALRMRYCAEKVRRLSLDNLNTRLMELQAWGQEEIVKQIETMLNDIREIKTGVFAPLGQQPLIKAILTLAGSLSGIALLEYVNQMNL